MLSLNTQRIPHDPPARLQQRNAVPLDRQRRLRRQVPHPREAKEDVGDAQDKVHPRLILEVAELFAEETVRFLLDVAVAEGPIHEDVCASRRVSQYEVRGERERRGKRRTPGRSVQRVEGRKDDEEGKAPGNVVAVSLLVNTPRVVCEKIGDTAGILSSIEEMETASGKGQSFWRKRQSEKKRTHYNPSESR